MARRIINRNYVCRLCGLMRRAPAAYVPGAPTGPECCGRAMRGLSYEQTVAATRMDGKGRVTWLISGGKITKAAGRRCWRPANSVT